MINAFNFRKFEKRVEEELNNMTIKELNVGTLKQAKVASIMHGKKAKTFLEGWRFARNNLQKQKQLMLKQNYGKQ